MTSVGIVNASPLVLLGKIRRLDLLFVGDLLDELEREGMDLGTDCVSPRSSRASMSRPGRRSTVLDR